MVPPAAPFPGLPANVDEFRALQLERLRRTLLRGYRNVESILRCAG